MINSPKPKASRVCHRLTQILACFLTVSGIAAAQMISAPQIAYKPGDPRPEVLRDIGLDQRLNEQVPLDTMFRDETGQAVALRKYFGSKPVVLAQVYFQCPMLCNEVLAGLTSSLTVVKFSAGKE